MLRGGKRRLSANDTILSDHALRKVEDENNALEQERETLRKEEETREKNLLENFTCPICFEVQGDEPLDVLIEPCGHRYHTVCWRDTHRLLTRNFQKARRTARVKMALGVADVELPLKSDFVCCQSCFKPIDWVVDLSEMGVPGE